MRVGVQRTDVASIIRWLEQHTGRRNRDWQIRGVPSCPYVRVIIPCSRRRLLFEIAWADELEQASEWNRWLGWLK